MVRAVGSHLPEWGALPVEAYMIVRLSLPESLTLDNITDYSTETLELPVHRAANGAAPATGQQLPAD